MDAPLQRRVAGLVRRFGDSVSVAGQSRSAIVAEVAPEDVTPWVGVPSERPVRVAYVAHDDPTSDGASVAWRGLTLTVLKAVDARRGSELVARMLILV